MIYKPSFGIAHLDHPMAIPQLIVWIADPLSIRWTECSALTVGKAFSTHSSGG